MGGWIWLTVDPDSIWWAASFCALVLGALLFVAKVPHQAAEAAANDEHSETKVSKDAIKNLVTNRSFIGFVILMFGTAALYDVIDQQYSIYFAEHVNHGNPVALFSTVVTIQIFAEAAIMLIAPWFVNKIGAKRGLQLVAAMRYITRMFDVRISATAYMLGFGVAKSLGVAVFSLLVGEAYEAIGFSQTYISMSMAIVAVTVIAGFLLRDDKGIEAPHGEEADGPAELPAIERV